MRRIKFLIYHIHHKGIGEGSYLISTQPIYSKRFVNLYSRINQWVKHSAHKRVVYSRSGRGSRKGMGYFDKFGSEQKIIYIFFNLWIIGISNF
jgi:hypothetical protein